MRITLYKNDNHSLEKVIIFTFGDFGRLSITTLAEVSMFRERMLASRSLKKVYRALACWSWSASEVCCRTLATFAVGAGRVPLNMSGTYGTSAAGGWGGAVVPSPVDDVSGVLIWLIKCCCVVDGMLNAWPLVLWVTAIFRVLSSDQGCSLVST